MTKKRTFCGGALLVAISLALAINLPSARAEIDRDLEAKFTGIEQTIGKYQTKKCSQGTRSEAYGKASKELNKILKQNPGEPDVVHRAELLSIVIQEKQDKDPLSNLKYTAAASYRRLIQTAGAGALDGKPRGGWPDPYVKQAYDNYINLSERVDAANRTKLEYKFLDFLVNLFGRAKSYSFWLAIVVVTLLVKLITTPLSHVQFESMRNMQRLQPKLEKLRKELEDDPREFQKQQWQLMKDHNANPLMGCLPLLVQLPFLMLLYRMIRAYEFQFAHGDFLWIGSVLADKVPFVGIIGASLADPDWILLVLYGLSMYISTKMSSSTAVDKAQADQQKMMAIMMPVMLLFFFKTFPSAFILYWLVLNVLTTTQQYFMLNKPVPALALEDDEPPIAATVSVAAGVSSPASGPRGPKTRKRR
ncbi:MAG: YidC/Oxa1 family membrane protein insertase [Armatimonadota bacterium]